jgi:cytochrome c-type biogenesis protein CcmH
MRTLLGLVAALLCLVAVPAQAAEPRASLPDIEDEVMCLECGTQLNVSTSDVADQEREFIAQLIAQGKTKAEVKAALVEEYGPNVLAEPRDDGFGLTAWVVPLLAGLAALALVVLTARRWRGARRAETDSEAGATPAPGVGPADARRLDAELAAYDR